MLSEYERFRKQHQDIVGEKSAVKLCSFDSPHHFVNEAESAHFW
jgi:hypothetical protein